MMFLDHADPRRLVWQACESPIEQMLCCGLFALLGCKAVHDHYRKSRRHELAEIAGNECAAFAFSQHWIQTATSDQKYRADFLLVLINPLDRTSRHIVLECDGKDFHSEPEQVANDQERDKTILKAGYHAVRRFTGREIHARLVKTIATIGADLSEFGVTCAVPEDCVNFTSLLFLPTKHTQRMQTYESDLYEKPLYGNYTEARDEFAFV